MESPYSRVSVSDWKALTGSLLNSFPLKMENIAQIVLESWEDIFKTTVGAQKYKLGVEILPQPQIMGFLLHELIPLNLASRYPDNWRRGMASTEFDVYCIFDERYSFEIKTSSDPKGVFGNRSYTQISSDVSKRRGGYMLTVNFEKFETVSKIVSLEPKLLKQPQLRLIRFGWLDATDWIGQTAQSGQQARLTKEAKAYKLKIIWEAVNNLKK